MSFNFTMASQDFTLSQIYGLCPVLRFMSSTRLPVIYTHSDQNQEIDQRR